MMKTSVSLIALSLLAVGCASHEPVTPAPAPVVVVPQQPTIVTAPAPAPGTVIVPSAGSTVAPMVVTPTALRFGMGRIESIAGNPSGPGHRLGLKMDDGTVQYVDSRAPNLSIGDRIEITKDGYMRHPA